MLRRVWRDMVDSREWVETRKQLRVTRAATFATAVEGVFARITGRVAALDATLLAAPFSERKCIAYWLLTEGRSAPFVEQLSVPFLLEQGGQSAIVDPRGARFSLSRTMVASARAFASPTRKQREILDQIVGPGIDPDSLAYSEATIGYGNELVIGGFLVREVDRDREAQSAGPYRGTPTRLRLIGAVDHPLLIANDRALVD